MSRNKEGAEIEIHELRSDDEVISTEKEVSLWRKIFPKVAYTSAREKRFVRKVDIFLLSWTVVAYFMKSVDQTNVSNAYVSGMKEELNFQGRDYNYLDMYFKIGYAISLIPSQILMNKTKPTYLLSTFEVIWGVLVCLCAVAKSPKDLYPLRFFIGFFEASSWPGIIITLMNYYTKDELALRIGIFQSSYYAGNMFSGFLQSAIYKTMEGSLGLFGFQWLFIINGVMTIVVGLAGYLFMPDTPENGGSWLWMNDDDRAIAVERMQRAGRKTKRQFNFKVFKDLAKDWRLYLFLLSYCPKAYAVAYSFFNLWLKSLLNDDGTPRWSVEQLNLIPIGGNAISVCSVIFWAALADLTQRPGPLIVILLSIYLFCNIVLQVWPSGLGIKYAAWFMLPIADATGPLLITLVAEVWSTSPEKRAIVTGSAVVLVYANNAWLSPVLWPANQVPRYDYAYGISILFTGVSLVCGYSFYYFVWLKAVKENDVARALRAAEVEQEAEGASTSEDAGDIASLKRTDSSLEKARGDGLSKTSPV